MVRDREEQNTVLKAERGGRRGIQCVLLQKGPEKWERGGLTAPAHREDKEKHSKVA